MAEPLNVDAGPKPYVVLIVGVNGAGKTTTIGKLARRYADERKGVILAAGDTFRAAAVEQLQQWGERNQVPVVAQGQGADSASVIFSALQAAQSRGLDLLASLPYVDDANGFGAIGHSLGGHNAIYTAVFDPRITVVASSCGFDSYRDYYDGAEASWYFGKGWCQIRYMPRMSDYRGKLESIPFDFPELLGALAPRPIFVNAPLGDSNFRHKSVDRCAEAARPVYKLLGGEGKLVVKHPDCAHDFPDDMREEAYRMLDSVLKKKD